MGVTIVSAGEYMLQVISVLLLDSFFRVGIVGLGTDVPASRLNVSSVVQHLGLCLSTVYWNSACGRCSPITVTVCKTWIQFFPVC